MRQFAYILTTMLIALAACTGVETVGSDTEGKTNEWKISYSWDTVSASRPDSMLIIANRAINTYRYVYSWNTDVNKGYKICESVNLGYKNNAINDSLTTVPGDSTISSAEQASSGLAAERKSVETIETRPGEYTAITATMHPDIIYACLDKEGFEYFMDSTISPRQISMYYRVVATDSVQSRLGHRWTDFNPVEKYILDLGPIYFAEKRNLTVKAGEQTAINFNPQDITQRLTLKFQIQLHGKDVSITDVVGDISGIASNVKLSSLYINTGPTRKMAYRAKMTSASDSTINCTATLNVPGILANPDSMMLTGAGILQSVLYAQTHDDEGKLVHKTYYTACNVSPIINEGNFVKLGDDNAHVVINGHDITIEIKSPIIIDRKTILELPDNKSSLNVWLIDEDFKQSEDIEI